MALSSYGNEVAPVPQWSATGCTQESLLLVCSLAVPLLASRPEHSSLDCVCLTSSLPWAVVPITNSTQEV